MTQMLSRTLAAGLAFSLIGVARVEAQPVASTVRASLSVGSIQGTVSDPRGRALQGVLVSALGATSAVAKTDTLGQFSLRGLPPGSYMLRAHLSGFVASEREIVDVRPNGRLTRTIQLRPVPDDPLATADTPEVLAAGFPGTVAGRAASGDPDEVDPSTGDHPHSPLAWRLRHVKRSVLRDANDLPAEIGGENGASMSPDDTASTWFAWAVESSTRLATTLFTEFPFTGEINLLTTGTLAGPQDFLSGSHLPGGIAFVSLGAPAGNGDWRMKAALSRGDVSSWIVAGSYARRAPSAHAYDVGLSFGTQEYKGGNTAAVPTLAGGSRSVGAVYGFDHWTVSDAVDLTYGARWARYDYVDRPNLLSPRVGIRVSPIEKTYVRAIVSQRMLAPGAEEFLPPSEGLWLPPERTFSPLGSDEFRVERVRTVEVALEQEFDDAVVLGVRRFYQRTDDQLVAIFGLSAPPAFAADPTHYFVAAAGGVDAQGWGVRLSSPMTRRLRGSIDYSLTHARWTPVFEPDLPLSAVRGEQEDIHDVTTSLEAAIPETSTRVYVVYKLNSAFARADGDGAPGLDGRFDLLVNQALPFRFISSQWEVLVGIRNMFREPDPLGSVYDELLVVDPPTRFVGGFLVRF
jgi:hypothetical protein